MHRLSGVALAAFIAAAAFGQSGESGLKFEAADIHATPAVAPGSSNNQFMRGGFYRGGRYEVRNATMVDLVRTAYGVTDNDKVTGGPAWMDKDHFDVTAKAPADSTQEKLQAMLRNLLAERFSLVVHNDTKPLAAYALTQGKKILMKAASSDATGCKFIPPPPPPPGGPMVGISNGTVQVTTTPGALLAYTCHNISMAEMPDQLRAMLFALNELNGIRVVDQTVLKGAWDFDLKYTLNIGRMMAPAEGAPEVVTIFAALEKQLGLKLELTKIPMAVIAVDSVNEKPTDNLPGVSAKMPEPPTEFEVADIRPSDPTPPPGPFRSGCFFCPGGRVNITRYSMSNLIGLAWNLNGNYDNRIAGLPKSAENVNWDIIAKASTMSPLNAPQNGQAPQQQIDFDSMRVMLQALLKDRFKLAIHEETRPLAGYALVAVKPKLKPADPTDRPGCKEGPGPDGKDPRTTNSAAGRLFTCLNMTLAEFAAEIPNRAGGYFGQFPGGVVDATKIEGKYDITLNFSGAGLVNGGGGRSGGGSGGGGAAGEAADPGGAISLQEAIEKQLGLKLEPQKNPGMVLVVDHVEEKPTEN